MIFNLFRCLIFQLNLPKVDCKQSYFFPQIFYVKGAVKLCKLEKPERGGKRWKRRREKKLLLPSLRARVSRDTRFRRRTLNRYNAHFKLRRRKEIIQGGKFRCQLSDHFQMRTLSANLLCFLHEATFEGENSSAYSCLRGIEQHIYI